MVHAHSDVKVGERAVMWRSGGRDGLARADGEQHVEKGKVGIALAWERR